jgi:hypothetical protein
LGSLPTPPPPGPTTISGVKWHDLDDDGFRDSDEPAIANTLIYVDYDGDGQLDLTEPTARTNARGEYSITIDRDGPVIIREVIPPGWQQTFPGGPSFRAYHQHPHRAAAVRSRGSTSATATAKDSTGAMLRPPIRRCESTTARDIRFWRVTGWAPWW